MHRRLLALVVASVLVLGAAACGDDDDGGGGFGAFGQTTEPGAVPAAGGDPAAGDPAAGAGYTQATHDDFVNECGNFPGATPDLCECAWGSITQSVPYADYQAFETAFASGSTDLPDWLTTAVANCS